MLSFPFGAPVKIKDSSRCVNDRTRLQSLGSQRGYAIEPSYPSIHYYIMYTKGRGNEWGTETNIVGYQNLEYAFVALRVRPKAPVTGMLRIPVLVLRFSE